MQYEIHGKPVTVNGECGLYKDMTGGLYMEYGILDTDNLVYAISRMPKHDVVIVLAALRDKAAGQAAWEFTPRNTYYPVLRGPVPTPIDVVREYIRNTEQFASDILAALSRE